MNTKFSTKNIAFLLSLLALINIVLRFPVTKHALGMDTFYIFAIAESISTFGYAKYILHPASFLGMYPYSYASAFMFLLSGLSQTTGIPMDTIILIIGIILAIFGAFSMFLLAKEVWNNDIFAFLVAFVFSISPNFVVQTYWNASTRGIFMALLPFFLWILVKYCRSHKLPLILCPFILILMVASHKMYLFLPMIIFALGAAVIIDRLSRKIKIRFFNNPDILQVHIFYILAFISFILFIIQFLNIGPFNVEDYYTGYLMRGTDLFSIFVNMAANYTGKLGIFFLFFVPGFLILIGKKNKKFGEIVIIFSAIIFLPFMGIEDYAPTFIFPILLLVSMIGFITILNAIIKNKRLTKMIFSVIMIISIIFTIFMLIHWNRYDSTTSETIFNSAQFIKFNGNGSVIANNGDLANRITAYSNKPTLPLGGVYSNDQPPGMVIFGFVNKTELRIQPVQIENISPNSNQFWIALNAPSAHMDWVGIIENYYGKIGIKKLLIKYKANLIIKRGISNTYWYWIDRYSGMMLSLYDSGNIVYSNGMETIYSLDPY